MRTTIKRVTLASSVALMFGDNIEIEQTLQQHFQQMIDDGLLKKR